jgi:hypothetical protein
VDSFIADGRLNGENKIEEVRMEDWLSEKSFILSQNDKNIIFKFPNGDTYQGEIFNG